jgi:hypothetical protein
MAEKQKHMLHVLVDVDIFKQAAQVAASRDETVSQVVRRALKAYVGQAPRQMDLEDAVRFSKPAKSR